jgi:hypothetical protein
MGSSISGSLNFRYMVTPAAELCLQYWENTDSTTWQRNTGTFLSLFLLDDLRLHDPLVAMVSTGDMTGSWLQKIVRLHYIGVVAAIID